MLADVLRLPAKVRLRVAFASFVLMLPPLAEGAPPGQSLSTSRQFIVYGTEVALRGAICDLAERTKRDLLDLLDQRDAWATPIVVNAQYPQANLPELPRLAVNLSQTGFGLKLQLDVTINTDISRPEVRREILRALLLEMIYRGESNIPAGTAYTSPPDWLLDGVPAQPSDLPIERVAGLLAMPVTTRSVLSLEKFLHQRPELLDAPGRLLHRAYSFALVDLLTREPEGQRRLARFIAELRSASNDPMAELRKHFPGTFDSGDAAGYAWEKQIARLATEQPYQLLSGAESERILAETLRIWVSDRGEEKSDHLAEFQAFLKHPSAKRLLAVMAQDLGRLAPRAHPLYRPIVTEYAQLTALLARGKTKGISAKLARLQGTRREAVAQMRGIDDYLNWFEATRLPGLSGAFADYMKAAESVARPPRTKRDPISIYLDAIETQFED